jgi:hypothetical protein
LIPITERRQEELKYRVYEIILTNGTVETKYNKRAFSDKQAVILAQAEAIQAARGYELVSVEVVG